MFLKTLFSWLLSFAGFLVLLLGIATFTGSFFVNALSVDDFNRIADEKIDVVIDENLETIKTEQNLQDIKPEEMESLKKLCAEQKPDTPFCDPDFLAGTITQDEAIKRMIKSQIDITGSEGIQQLVSYVDAAKKINGFLYGVLLFLGGSLIILIAKFFDVKSTLSTIFYESAFASFISAINFKAMPFLLDKISSLKFTNGSASELTKVFSDVLTEWLAPGLNAAFALSLLLTIIFTVGYVIMLVISKKSSSGSSSVGPSSVQPIS